MDANSGSYIIWQTIKLNNHMNKLSYILIVIISVTMLSCAGNNRKASNDSGNTEISYNNPEEELCAIMEELGWEQISNNTNVYRKDLDKIINERRTYKTTYWYTAAIYCKTIGDKTKYIVARPIYESRKDEDPVAQRHDNGELKYKTFAIVDCSYTDKYGKAYNGYISDGGSTAYLNY